MKFNKLIIYLAIIFIINLSTSCNKKVNYDLENSIISSWAYSIKTLNYKEYVKYEANAKEKKVFNEMYKEYYIDSPVVYKVESDLENEKEDKWGNKYYQKKVYFNGYIIMRDKQKDKMLLKADALLIKYTNGDRKNDGWLLFNRTFVRIPNY